MTSLLEIRERFNPVDRPQNTTSHFAT